jgi:hypothetical protein
MARNPPRELANDLTEDPDPEQTTSLIRFVWSNASPCRRHRGPAGRSVRGRAPADRSIPGSGCAAGRAPHEHAVGLQVGRDVGQEPVGDRNVHQDHMGHDPVVATRGSRQPPADGAVKHLGACDLDAGPGVGPDDSRLVRDVLQPVDVAVATAARRGVLAVGVRPAMMITPARSRKALCIIAPSFWVPTSTWTKRHCGRPVAW